MMMLMIMKNDCYLDDDANEDEVEDVLSYNFAF